MSEEGSLAHRTYSLNVIRAASSEALRPSGTPRRPPAGPSASPPATLLRCIEGQTATSGIESASTSSKSCATPLSFSRSPRPRGPSLLPPWSRTRRRTRFRRARRTPGGPARSPAPGREPGPEPGPAPESSARTATMHAQRNASEPRARLIAGSPPAGRRPSSLRIGVPRYTTCTRLAGLRGAWRSAWLNTAALPRVSDSITPARVPWQRPARRDDRERGRDSVRWRQARSLPSSSSDQETDGQVENPGLLARSARPGEGRGLVQPATRPHESAQAHSAPSCKSGRRRVRLQIALGFASSWRRSRAMSVSLGCGCLDSRTRSEPEVRGGDLGGGRLSQQEVRVAWEPLRPRASNGARRPGRDPLAAEAMAKSQRRAKSRVASD